MSRRMWKFPIVVFTALFVVAFAAAPAAHAVSPAPPLANATNGDGLMDVAPTNVTYGTAASYVFTFTANADFQLNSQVALTIPTGWTPPTAGAGAGHVSVSSGTCVLSGSPGWQVGAPPNDMTIFVDLDSCATGNSLTINYNGSPPGVTGSPFTFATQTDIGTGGEGLVPITAGSPIVTIDPKVLTVSGGFAPNGKIYDGTTVTSGTTGSPTLLGVIGGDSVSLDSTAPHYDFADRNAGTGKVVTVTGLLLTGAAAPNYILTDPTRSANITPSPISITAATDSKVYDGTTSSTGLPTITSVRGIQTGDTEPTWTQAFANRNVGTGKTLTPSGVVNDSNSGNNYTYTYVANTSGTITKRPITVTAATSVKTYDRTISSTGVPTLTLGAIQTGDTEPAWTQTFDTKDAGTNKTLMPAGLVSDGNGGNNYAYTYQPDTTGVITPKTLTVSSAGLTPANKVYDGTTAGSGTTGSPSLVGVIAGDTVTLVTSGATYTFADRNAGNGKLVHVGGLTLGGGAAANYSLTQPDRTANIAPRPLGITAATDSREYDGTNHSSGLPTLTSGTIQTGDVAAVWTQTFADKNAGTGKTLIPAGVVSDANSGNNYTYTYISNTTGVITQRAITVTAISDTKIYDGTTQSIDTPTWAPALAPSDTAAFTQAFSTKDVGTGRTITPAGVVLDGNNGNNYSYTYTPVTTGVINALAITVTAITDQKTYDGTTASSGAPNISPPLVGTDTSGFSQTFDTKDAGTGKTLTPAGHVNDGNGGADYTVTFANDVNGVILARATDVTADPQSKAIGSADPPLTYTVSPALLGGDTMSGALTRAAGETAGLYAITRGSLDAGLNYIINFSAADLLIGPAISGNAGVTGVSLVTDGTPYSTTSTAGGDYSLIVPANWTGTVTPSLIGYVFTPASRSYSTPVTSNLTGENYTASLLVTVPVASTKTLDGWVLESAETSSVGGSRNAGAKTFNLGDDAANRQYRAVLSFNTGTALPGGAVVTAATLQFKKAGQVGANPFASLGKIVADVKPGAFGTPSLQISDFQTKVGSTGKNSALTFTNTLLPGNWYSQDIASTDLGLINLAGVTQIRLRFTKDDNNNLLANYLKIYSGDAAAGSRPLLVITYYVP